MRTKIYNAIGMLILGSLLVLLSGATGEPFSVYDPPAASDQLAEMP